MKAIEAYVLAGGQSKRMGKDKGLTMFKKKPMISHVIMSLEALNLPVTIITANSGYAQFGHRLLEDIIPGKGPMGGLYTALKTTSADAVLLLSCDMPAINPEILRLLVSGNAKNKIKVFEVKGKIYPFPGIYPRDLLSTVTQKLKNEELKMLDLICKHDCDVIDLAPQNEQLFININNQQDLIKLEELWPKSQ
jgi:molybdenum cofactor guanylyltransferase